MPVSLTIGLCIDAAITMLIWLVQLVIYPAFAHIREDRFHDWHRGYMHTISFIVIPLMLIQGALVMGSVIREASLASVAAAALVLCSWTVTFTLSVPAHKVLQQQGNGKEPVRRLVSTNWLRTVSWSGVLIIHLFTWL